MLSHWFREKKNALEAIESIVLAFQLKKSLVNKRYLKNLLHIGEIILVTWFYTKYLTKFDS